MGLNTRTYSPGLMDQTSYTRGKCL